MRHTSSMQKLDKFFFERIHTVPLKQNTFWWFSTLASDEFSPENVFPVFKTLFQRKQISNCRRDLTWIPGYYSSRPLPRELDYRFTCHSYKTCKGSSRKPNVFSPPPGFDDDYFMTDIFLFCRFGAKLSRWFSEIIAIWLAFDSLI